MLTGVGKGRSIQYLAQLNKLPNLPFSECRLDGHSSQVPLLMVV